MSPVQLIEQIERHWSGKVQCTLDAAKTTCEIRCAKTVLPALCGWLFLDWNFSFAGLIVEETDAEWQLRYSFFAEGESGWVHVLAAAPLVERTFPSIVKFVHAADWHEREAEDLFGLVFEGHPRLGDFVLHNDAWQESVEPMRHGFDASAAMLHRQPDPNWRPLRIVQEPGAFVMPIGPIYSGVTESAHFLLETVGENVIRATPRLFYKWRAVEKLAEGKTVDQVLPLAERFAATTAFAHGLAFSLAVESICRASVPRGRKPSALFSPNSNASANTPAPSRKSANPPPWSSPTARPESSKKTCCASVPNSPGIAICLAWSCPAAYPATSQTRPARKRFDNRNGSSVR